MKKTVKANTLCARPITFEDWILYAINAMGRSEDHISQLWTGSTILITLLALFALPSLGHKTATTSMMAKFIVTSTTRHNLPSGAMGAKLQFSSNLLRSSAMVRISTGIQNAT